MVTASFDLEDLFLTFQETSVKFFEEWDPSPLNERGRDFCSRDVCWMAPIPRINYRAFTWMAPTLRINYRALFTRMAPILRIHYRAFNWITLVEQWFRSDWTTFPPIVMGHGLLSKQESLSTLLVIRHCLYYINITLLQRIQNGGIN